jgi:hypothetical protein
MLPSSTNASMIPSRRHFDSFARFHAATRGVPDALTDAAMSR